MDEIIHNCDNITNTPDLNNRFVSLPFIRGAIPRMAKTFSHTDNIKVANRLVQTIRSTFSKLKGKTNVFPKSNIIYEIPSQNCNKGYIGQTRDLYRDT